MSNYCFDTGTAGYDDEDRLTNWERDDTNLDQSWNLSAVGDWTSFTENTVAVSRTHNAVHELTAIATTPLTYDAKGNLITDDASLTYAWDADNMLSSATVPTAPSRGLEGTHTYDALGRRTSKTVNDTQQSTTETIVFISLTQTLPNMRWAGRILAEYTSGSAASSPLRKYAYGEYIDEPLVLIDRTAAGSTGAGSDETFYYHRNQQYSITALSNASGTIAERYHYTPYGYASALDEAGVAERSESHLENACIYTGRRLDTETGLHYFRARYYTPNNGRFLGRDRFLYSDGENLYSFLGERPSQGLDPTGQIRLKQTKPFEKPACPGRPGTVSWRYSLEGKAPCHGLIVQEVVVSCSVRDCSSSPICKDSYTYYEAWPIKIGLQTSRIDSATYPPRGCTLGVYRQRATAKFYCNTTVGLDEDNTNPLRSPPGWDPGDGRLRGNNDCCPTSAGDFTATDNRPKWWDDPVDGGAQGIGTGHRKFNLRWAVALKPNHAVATAHALLQCSGLHEGDAMQITDLMVSVKWVTAAAAVYLACSVHAAYAADSKFPVDGSVEEIRTFCCKVSVQSPRLVMFSDDTNAALVAAWQLLRLDAAPGQIGQSSDRFIGFFEGRTRINLPQWWEKELSAGSVHLRNGEDLISQSGFMKAGSVDRWVTRRGVRCNGVDDILQDGSWMRFSSEGVTVSSKIDNFADNEGSRVLDEWGAVAIAVTEEYSFVSFGADGIIGTRDIYCLSNSDGTVRWTQSIDSGMPHHIALGGGFAGGYSEISVVDDLVVVTGCHDFAMYVYAYHKMDGMRVVHFSTKYAEFCSRYRPISQPSQVDQVLPDDGGSGSD